MTCEIFGILNVTPDSFSDGGKFYEPQMALTHAKEMLEEGAHFLDIGGESTRPNADIVTAEQEWGRVEPVISLLLQNDSLRSRVSLDTQKPEVAEQFFTLGGEILNDVAGLANDRMKELAAQYAKKVIVGHFPGKNITEVHEQKIDSIDQVCDELLTRREELLRAGIASENIILDPNIGFGKTMECNWELLKFAELVPEYEVMIGHSRKRFLGEHRFEIFKNIEAAQIAIDAGARYLRVHDVQEYVHLLSENH
jgi:dihydropteroate synthase